MAHSQVSTKSNVPNYAAPSSVLSMSYGGRRVISNTLNNPEINSIEQMNLGMNNTNPLRQMLHQNETHNEQTHVANSQVGISSRQIPKTEINHIQHNKANIYQNSDDERLVNQTHKGSSSGYLNTNTDGQVISEYNDFQNDTDTNRVIIKNNNAFSKNSARNLPQSSVSSVTVFRHNNR
ncbi:hypothetical protein BB561_003571 [Smittium simulii]|uniref:Uncharacterized protein n=1 Tax=Smittium simulii TaxID=133385 RepID=A0A2T9YKK6_9FUNG|nr:hypothetical protein BB561_003571 [Smittium simulii]